MPTTRVKCVDCFRTRKLHVETVAEMRQLGKEEGGRVGALCPDCVLKAYDNEAVYAVDISDGEMMVDQLRDRPPWRMVIMPKQEG